MELAAAKKRIAELSKELEAHNYRYYVLNDPTVSDFSYDEMMRELRELEAAFPSLQLPTSPTQRVGGVASSTFEKVQHAVQMMSLQDVFSFAEVSAFLTRCKEQFSNPEFVVEPKIDGLSVSLEYTNGVFTRGSTRGDGFVGEDALGTCSGIFGSAWRSLHAERAVFVADGRAGTERGNAIQEPTKCRFWFAAAERCLCDGKAWLGHPDFQRPAD